MRLINADALLENWKSLWGGDEEYVETIRYKIAEAPTVDAVPVVHGEWLPIKDDYGHLYQGQCSRCGCEPLRNPFHSPWRFCPNCGANNGAKMEREGKQ